MNTDKEKRIWQQMSSLEFLVVSYIYALTVSMISTSVMEEIRRSWEKDSSIQIIIRDFSYH